MGVKVSGSVTLTLESMALDTDEDDAYSRVYGDVQSAVNSACEAWRSGVTDISVELDTIESDLKVAELRLTATVLTTVKYGDGDDPEGWASDHINALIMGEAWDDYSVTVVDSESSTDPDDADHDVEDTPQEPTALLQRQLDDYRDALGRRTAEDRKKADLIQRISLLCSRFGANANGLTVWGLIDPDIAYDLAVETDRYMATQPRPNETA